MNTQEQGITRKNDQRVDSANRNMWLRGAAFVAVVAVVATTVVMIGGSEPAHACLLPGIPC